MQVFWTVMQLVLSGLALFRTGHIPLFCRRVKRLFNFFWSRLAAVLYWSCSCSGRVMQLFCIGHAAIRDESCSCSVFGIHGAVTGHAAVLVRSCAFSKQVKQLFMVMQLLCFGHAAALDLDLDLSCNKSGGIMQPCLRDRYLCYWDFTLLTVHQLYMVGGGGDGRVMVGGGGRGGYRRKTQCASVQ
jgi:hypothetical protein